MRVTCAQVLGLEALHTRDVRNTHALLANHLNYVRSMPLLGNTTAVMSFESNLAFESQHLLHHLHSVNFKKWVSMSEGAHNGLGWLTTHGRKESMALLLREAMRVGKISFHPSFFSISMSSGDARKRLGDELRNFSVITEPGKTHFSKSRKTYTVSVPGPQLAKHDSYTATHALVRCTFVDLACDIFTPVPVRPCTCP